MYLEIDFSSDEAIYQQLCDQIIYGIATSRLEEGEVLPSVRQLADDIGVNMHTVNKAYTVLKQEGFVKVDRRKGAIISVDADKERARKLIRKDFNDLLAQARCRGLTREDIHDMVDELYDAYDAYDEYDKGRPQLQKGGAQGAAAADTVPEGGASDV